VMSRGEVGFAEGHADRGRRFELLQYGLEDGLDKGGVNLDFPDYNLHGLRTLSDSEGDVFKGDRLLTRLLEALESPGAGVELATRARDEAAWLHVVNLDSLLAPGGEAELGFSFEAGCRRESAQQHLTVTNVHGLVIQQAFARFAAVERVADFARRGDQQ